MEEKILEVKDISKKYKKNVLNNISFSISKGSSVGILGRNGVGKSTLISIITGNLKPDTGNIFFNGKSASGDSNIFGNHIGYVPQSNPLITELTVLDNLKLWYFKKSQVDYMNEVVNKFEMVDELTKKISELSGGLKKRVSIMCVLSNKPQILMLDEPSASLDIAAKEELKVFLKKYINDNGTIIMTTHDETEFDFFDELYVIKDCGISKLPDDVRRNEIIKYI